MKTLKTLALVLTAFAAPVAASAGAAIGVESVHANPR